MKIKKGDNVLIRKGKDGGKTGKVASVNPSKNKVLVHGLNQYKKTVRARKQGEKGQIITISMPLNASNVSIVCPSCGKATRVGYKVEGEAKTRFCKKCKSAI